MFRDPSDPYLSLSPASEDGGAAAAATTAESEDAPQPLDPDQVDKDKSAEQDSTVNRSNSTAKPSSENPTPTLSARRIAINKWRLTKRKISIFKKTILKRWFVVLHYVRHGAHPIFDVTTYLPQLYFENRSRLVFSLLSLALAGYITYVYKFPSQ
jgi:hypothetical protein